MEINIENRERYIYIKPVGRIDSQTAPEFQKTLHGVSETGSLYIVDFTSVPYMSSAGLRVVMIAAKASSVANGKIVFCGMQSAVQEIFEMSGFSAILNTCGDVISAEQQL